MAEYRITLGVDVDIGNVQAQLNNIRPDPIDLRVNLNTRDLQNQIGNIRQQLTNLSNIRINIGGNVGGRGGGIRQVNEATQAFNELMRIQNEINSKRISLNGLQAAGSANEMHTLLAQIQQLENSYNNLLESFNAQGIQFTADQWTRMQDAIAKTGRQVEVVQSRMADNNVAEQQTRAYRELLSVSKEINSLELNLTRLRGQGGNDNQIEVLENQLRTLQTTYQQLVTTLDTPLTADQWSSIYTQIGQAQDKIAQLQAKFADARANMAQGITDKLDAGGFDNEVSKIISDFDKLSNKTAEARTAIGNLRSSLVNMKTAAQNGDNDALINANREYVRSLKDVENQLKMNKRAEQDALGADILQNKKAGLLSETKQWLKENSAAAAQFGDRIREIQVALANCSTDGQFKKLSSDFTTIKKEAKEAGVATQTFGDKLRTQFEKYSAYVSVASLFMYVTQGLKDMFKQVVAIDAAMTELKKVTNETDASYDKFLNNAASRAKEIGTTIDGLVSSTADFARLGYSFEESAGLAEVANIYTVVGDEIDGVDTATQSLVSTLAAFKHEMGDMSDSDFAMSIVDKFNEVSNNFAISSGGIGEALQRSASSLAAANTTLDESIALITAANTVVQNPEKVGNAFKTISMRIRGAKTELEEAGESTEGMAESTASLREEIMALSGVDIMQDEDTFKSTYAIMDELAEKWEGLSDIAQASITELIAGKHQGNVMSSLMANFDIARNALETSQNSAGSALAEHAKWSDSLEARLNKLKATWQSLSQSFLSSNFLKGGISAITGFVNGLDALVNKFGALPTLIGTFAGSLSLFKNKGLFTFDKDTKSIELLGQTFSEFGKKYELISTKINKYNSLNAQHQLQFCDTMKTSTTSFGRYMSGLKGSKASMGGYIASLVGAKAATFALQAATVALNAALTMGISALISWGISALDKWIVTADELAEKVDEVTTKYKDQHNELMKLKGDYDTSKESSMISKYAELSKGVDSLGKNVSLTTDEYAEYQNIVNTIADQIPSLVSGYDSQGNAILSCTDNIEQLTSAYEGLIKAQNNEVLKGENADDIEKDFKNAVKKANKSNAWNTEETMHSINALEKMLNGAYSKEQISELLDKNVSFRSQLASALEDAGLESDIGLFSLKGTYDEFIADAISNHPEVVRRVIDDFNSTFESEADGVKSQAAATLSEAFDISDSEYAGMSEKMQNLAYQIVNSFDANKYNEILKTGTVQDYINNMLDSLKALEGTESGKKIEAAFDLKTQFNGGDISYGKYVDSIQEVGELIDTLNVSDDVKSQLKLALDTNDITAEYDALMKRLTSEEIKWSDKQAKTFLDSLSSEEFAIAMDIIPKLDDSFTIDDVRAMIEEKLAVEFEFDIAAQIEGISALNTALEEARSATGLTAESIDALKGRYKDLDNFNAAALFEETAIGVRLNNEELARLEAQYETVNKLDIDKNLSTLATKYNKLTDEIKNCTDAKKKEELQNQADIYADEIEKLSTLASMYDGLTSNFNKWINAQSSPNDGDNYDSIYDNLKAIKELRNKGLVGTDDFKTAAQLMTNEDLSNASIDKIVSAFDKGYPKMKKYFTDGQQGCKNFLNDISKINSEWAHLNEDGKWEINFDAKEAADELGTSVDSIYLIAQKLKDYGFEIKLEDTSLDNLQTDIEKAESKLKELGEEPYPVNLDVEAENVDTEIDKIKAHIKEINNSSVEPDVKSAKLEDARAKLEALIQKKQEASQPAFMSLNTSQVNASLVDALGKVQAYQTAINEVNKLSELKESGIAIDDSQITTAKQNAQECLEAIQGLDGNVKLAIGLEEDGSLDSIKEAFENGEVHIDVNTDPAVTKIEQLVENVDKIEDKDVTINVTVNGLDDVKELNKQINLATNIDGDIDKLSEFVDGAKALTELSNNIVTYVDANIEGNVKDTPEYMINNLKSFAEGAKSLEGVGSLTSSVTANLDGNVKDIPEFMINNLKTFSDSAKDVASIGSVESKVTANIEGNVTGMLEESIDNLKTFSDSAKDVASIGDISSSVTANINGNVKDLFEAQIDNLTTYVDSAKDVASIGAIESSVTANINGNVTGMLEASIDNLKVYSDSAKDIASIGDVSSSVSANINGNVTGMLEASIDNLKAYTDSAKDVVSIGDVSSSVTANINGNVTGMLEESIDNIKVFADSAKELNGIGDITSSVTANINGNVTTSFEEQIDNLKVFAEGAKELQGINSEDVTISANIEGNLKDGKTIENLAQFAASAKDLQGIGSSNVTITASVNGNVLDASEFKINNLEAFANGAKLLENISSSDVTISANIEGNVKDTPEYMINNLRVFSDSAKDMASIGDVESSVTANINGNVTGLFEEQIDNLKVFSDSAKDIASVGTVESSVTANIEGNVTGMLEASINNLKTYVDSAKDVASIGDVSSSVTANINGNVTGMLEESIDNLKTFSDSAKDVASIGNVESSVTADIHGNVVWMLETSIDNLKAYAECAKELNGINTVTSSVTADIYGNATDDAISRLEKFASLVGRLQSSQSVNIGVNASVDTANINNAITLLQKVANSGLFQNYSASVTVTATPAETDLGDGFTGEGKAIMEPNETDFGHVFEGTGTAYMKPNTYDFGHVFTGSGTVVLSYTLSGGGIGGVGGVGGVGAPVKVSDGTAHANGSAFVSGTVESGIAFAHGDWRTKKTETALTGELGRELVVTSDNRWFTVGDYGAEFAKIPRGSIVFNHRQTEELFKNGYVTSNGGRGTLHGKAFASGTAFANGTTNVSGKAFLTGSGDFFDGGGGDDGDSGGGSGGEDKTEENKNEVFDWIEKLLERFDRAIDMLDKAANNIYKSFDKRNDSLSDEITKVTEQISNQKKAYERYIAEAETVGDDIGFDIGDDFREKIRKGDFSVDVLNDEQLIEYIGYFEEWYEKALECQEAIQDLEETLSSLYALRVENVATQYEGILGVIEHEKNILEEYINQSETQAWLVSSKYYDALASNERETIAELKNQKAEMLIAFEEAMASGTIDEGSESYYEMVASIDEVTLAIKESETALLEYEQTVQQLDWEIFDLLQDKISSVNEETEFLIELLSNKKLYDDNGQLTNEGSATMGLHGVAYNTYMHQADLAAEEIAKLKKELEEDPFDTELEERYREMIALQQEYILSAESQKNAIKDLVEEGIQLELDALDERIEKYNEALDSQKDLYEYQKKVSEQTSEIASLQKQMAAYDGDDSEEAKAKLQELRVSLEEAEADLEETEYDKYISDTQQMLDNITLEYEELLNTRMDNIDYLVEQMIDEINADSSIISDTIRETADKVGYTLTDSMSAIWDKDSLDTKNVITTYGDKFVNAQTTTNNALNAINTNLQNMINQLNKKATANTKSASTSSVAKSSNKKTNTTKTTTKKSNGGDGKPKIGDRVKYVSGQYYYDSQGKKPLGSHNLGKYVYITNINEKDWATHGYHISTGKKLGSGDLGWLKLNQISGYATGKKNFLDNEIAWTQEDGKEFIVRPSDGAILTPVAKGDSILTSAASKNIWDFANSPAEFIKDNLNFGSTSAPNNSNSQNNYTQYLDKVVFNLPNVKNYEQFLTAMQKDKNFERLIQSMTIDQISGKSSLGKGKSIR